LPDAVTVIARVFAPLDQRYDAPADAVSVTLPPAQKVVGPSAETAAAGSGDTVTFVAALVALQPFASVVATLYAPLAATVIDCVVAPFDQRYDAAADAVSVTLPPAQNVVAPPAVMTGVAGAVTVTVVAALVALQPFAFVTVTL
jgi:hypothetical protein